MTGEKEGDKKWVTLLSEVPVLSSMRRSRRSIHNNRESLSWADINDESVMTIQQQYRQQNHREKNSTLLDDTSTSTGNSSSGSTTSSSSGSGTTSSGTSSSGPSTSGSTSSGTTNDSSGSSSGSSSDGSSGSSESATTTNRSSTSSDATMKSGTTALSRARQSSNTTGGLPNVAGGAAPFEVRRDEEEKSKRTHMENAPAGKKSSYRSVTASSQTGTASHTGTALSQAGTVWSTSMASLAVETKATSITTRSRSTMASTARSRGTLQSRTSSQQSEDMQGGSIWSTSMASQAVPSQSGETIPSTSNAGETMRSRSATSRSIQQSNHSHQSHHSRSSTLISRTSTQETDLQGGTIWSTSLASEAEEEEYVESMIPIKTSDLQSKPRRSSTKQLISDQDSEKSIDVDSISQTREIENAGTIWSTIDQLAPMTDQSNESSLNYSSTSSITNFSAATNGVQAVRAESTNSDTGESDAAVEETQPELENAKDEVKATSQDPIEPIKEQQKEPLPKMTPKTPDSKKEQIKQLSPTVVPKTPNVSPAEENDFQAFLMQMRQMQEQPMTTMIKEFVPTETAEKAKEAGPFELPPDPFAEDDASTIGAKSKSESDAESSGTKENSEHSAPRSRTDSRVGVDWRFISITPESDGSSGLQDLSTKKQDIPLSYSPSARMQPWGPNTSDLWTSTTRLLAAIPEEVGSVISSASMSYTYRKDGGSIDEHPKWTKESRICLGIAVITILFVSALGTVFVVVAVLRPPSGLAPTGTPTVTFADDIPPPPYLRPTMWPTIAPTVQTTQPSVSTPSIDPFIDAGENDIGFTQSPSASPTGSVNPTVSIFPTGGTFTFRFPTRAPSTEPSSASDAFSIPSTGSTDSPSNNRAVGPGGDISSPSASPTGSVYPTMSSLRSPSLAPSSFPTIQLMPIASESPTLFPTASTVTLSPSLRPTASTMTLSPSTSSESLSPTSARFGSSVPSALADGIKWAPNGQVGGSFQSVSISGSGDRVMASSTNDVKVFEKRGDGVWEQLGESFSVPGVHAITLSRDGNTMAQGAYFDSDSSSSVALYRWNGFFWNKMGSSLPGSCAFMTSLDLSYNGNIVAIGSPLQNSYAGYAEVYEFDGTTGDWKMRGSRISGSSTGDLAGASVSLSYDGTVLAVGSPGNSFENFVNRGQASILQYNPNFGWSKVGQTLSGLSRLKQFGYSISLSSRGTRVAIGAPFIDQSGSLKGEVHVYDLSLADRMWYPVGNVIEGLFFADSCGESVSLSQDGQTLAIGAPKRRYVRVMTVVNEEWIEIGFVDSSQPSFASTVSLTDNGRSVAVASGTTNAGEFGLLILQRYDTVPLPTERTCRRNISADPSSVVAYCLEQNKAYAIIAGVADATAAATTDEAGVGDVQ